MLLRWYSTISISRRCLIRSRNIRLIYCICWELLLILGCTFVRILWWYRFHITVSFSISHSLVHTNSSCTSSTSCFSSSLNNFSSSFTCHGRTCTCHFRTSIRSEEHTSELQSRLDLHSFPTRRSSDLCLFWDVPLLGSCGGTGFTLPFRFPSRIPLYIPTPPAPAPPAAFPPVLTTFPAPLPAMDAPAPAIFVPA